MESLQERRDRWKRSVEQWRESSLSAAAWCREQKISYVQFLYWKDRLHPKPPEFIEVADCCRSGLVFECKGIQLHLEKDFDETSLARVISVLHRC